MASSQVEIASSPSPFGCILRDHNQRGSCRESKWRQFLTKDHLNPIISIPSDHNPSNEIENSWIPNNLQLKAMSQSHSTKRPKTERKALSRSESLGEAPNLGASSLVQIWESRLNRSNSTRNPPKSCGSASLTSSGLSSINGLETGEERLDLSQESSPCRSQGSEVAESERVRVVDIIKRLAAGNQDDQSGSGGGGGGGGGLGFSPLSDQPEQRIFSQSLISPMIRGRQAFADLLMQLERDRHRELEMLAESRAVSKFSQRGRIQAMLRIRSLQRGIVVQDQHLLRTSSPPQASSSITHLRERFSTKAENGVTSRSGNSENPRSHCSEKPIKAEEQKQNHEAIFIEKQDATTQTDHSLHATEHVPEEPFPRRSSALQETKLDSQETGSETRNLDSQETNIDSLEAVGTMDAIIASRDGWDENEALEESEENYSQYAEETNYDWINEISRPRSYWEDRRQEWYHEMLNPDSKNAEIRHLLERGTVSGFLASEFRERMDRLMEARLGRQNMHPVSSQVEREEEEERLISGQYNDANRYFERSTSSLQIPLPSLLGRWSFHENEEAQDDSEREVSTSPCRDFPSQSYQNDRQHSPSVHHPSIEMELICELRGQMEQVYHEMSDLRNCLKSCLGIQMVLLQRSMNHQPHSAKNTSHKGNCCICYERKVDSLLYRCGHMCTCVKCAHELQWSSGKCPICCAPIVDVVRAYLD